MQTKNLGWAWVLLLVAAVAGCSRPPPEQRLRQSIAQMQAAVEEGDRRGFLRHVDEEFVGNGGMDREQLERMLRAHMLVNKQVGVHLGPLDIEMGDGTAVVRFTAALTGGSGGLLPERARMQSITSGWREVEGQWQVYHAQWQGPGRD